MDNHALLSQSRTDPTSTDAGLPFTSVFHPESIETIRKGTVKSTVIGLLVDALAREERIDRQHAEIVVRDLLERERHFSSAIGKGLAFPHLRTTAVTQFVGAIGIAPEGLLFGSLDGEPTKLIFLILSPFDDRQQHTDLLSRLVGLMKDKAVHLQLMHCLQTEDVYNHLADLDAQSQTSSQPLP